MEVEGGQLGSAIERLQQGEEAILVVDAGREVAAVLSIDEYRRFAGYRALEDEGDLAAARKILADPHEGWASWESVREEIGGASSR